MPELLNAAQAATILGVSRQRVNVLSKEGRLGQRFGKRWVYTRDEIDAFAAQPRPPHRPRIAESVIQHMIATDTRRLQQVALEEAA